MSLLTLLDSKKHFTDINRQIDSYCILSLTVYAGGATCGPNRYSFTPERSEAHQGEVPCIKTKYRNSDIPVLRGEKHDISLQSAKLYPSSHNFAALQIDPTPYTLGF